MGKIDVKYPRWGIRVFCLLLMVCLLTGCAASHSTRQETNNAPSTKAPTATETTGSTQPVDTAPATEPTEPPESWDDPSLVSLRQVMIDNPPVFAVAYFGVVTAEEDPFEVILAAAPQLCEDLPFVLNIPIENVIGTEGQLFCIVPGDENATVSVNRYEWDEEVLYRSESGDPILVMCPNDGEIPDTTMIITDSDGTVVYWYPHIDDSGHVAPLCDDSGESLLLDFTAYDEMCGAMSCGGDYLDMVGNWERVWTEVESDRVDTAPGSCTVEITTDGMGFFWISYTDKNFPDDNFSDKELLITAGELYYGCGNNRWFAEVYETSEATLHYAVTVLDDGSLLMQYSWEMDGMPMVSYGLYQRVS